MAGMLSRLRNRARIASRRRRPARGRGGLAFDDWTMKVAAHRFTDRELGVQSMSHRSWCGENAGRPSNERLEFLGDAILQWVVTDMIYAEFPERDEGSLTDIRKSLVNAEMLAEIAREIDLGSQLLLGAGEDDAGGRSKTSILADALEAFIGALYLDGGPQKAQPFVQTLIRSRLSGSFERLEDFDARSHLIRVCVREWSRPPLVEISSEGAAHEPTFTAVVVINGEEMGRAEGRSKKIAAQAASVGALAVLAARGVDTSRA
ncbi:MAG: ribonuclease [Actinomycetota bacterium]|nr:ribonuclease III [Actinomycetota bacterium]NDD97327.1 ribonuclease III [Actinomycetota bacterium]NDF31288.1 ribonuclease III [Acidimicrobiia bacterium]